MGNDLFNELKGGRNLFEELKGGHHFCSFIFKSGFSVFNHVFLNMFFSVI